MTGGLLNLVAIGNENIILTGNPSKTFFKFVYAKYTNFGLQRMRIDYEGQRTLEMSEESVFSFKIPRYAELLMDTYLLVNIPDIWSPVELCDCDSDDSDDDIDKLSDCDNSSNSCCDDLSSHGKKSTKLGVPYEFQWIEDLGIQIVKDITVTAGGQILQQFSGAYLSSLKKRDYHNVKKDLYDKMIGNTAQFNDPAHYGRRCGHYPNAVWTDLGPAEPSIRGRTLYIPIDIWFTLSSKMAFPLISLQYNELKITVTFRPVREWFSIRDVTDPDHFYPRIAPNFNIKEHQFYRFIQPPPNRRLDYDNKNTAWASDINLYSTYCFLTDDESRIFAAQRQQYLIKEVHEYNFKNVTGTHKVKLDSLGLVADWMFYFQRSDVNLRNQWSNYTNWEYNHLPFDVLRKVYNDESDDDFTILAKHKKGHSFEIETIHRPGDSDDEYPKNVKPACGCSCSPSCNILYNSGIYQQENHKLILLALGILFDGQYREELLPAGVYNYIEKYVRTGGNAPDGLYCYNFCLHTDPHDLQPSGAVNMSKFNRIEFEFVTYEPIHDDNAHFFTICDKDGQPIGVNKPVVNVYKYDYDLTVFEERFNVVTFISGNCGLMYAR